MELWICLTSNRELLAGAKPESSLNEVPALSSKLLVLINLGSSLVVVVVEPTFWRDASIAIYAANNPYNF